MPINEPNMHTLSARLAKRDEKIKELQAEIARLKIGGQPASKVRDLVLTALRCAELNLDVGNVGRAQTDLKELITALGENIPGDVAYKPAPPPHDGGMKPYVPLDHGPRDNEAAAAQYRTQPR